MDIVNICNGSASHVIVTGVVKGGGIELNINKWSRSQIIWTQGKHMCVPDNDLNLITSDLNFQCFSFTSIQWAVISRTHLRGVRQPSVCSYQDISWSCLLIIVSHLSLFIIHPVAYHNIQFHLLHVLHTFIVNVNFNIVCCWNVSLGWFWPHWDKSVMECRIIGKCERPVVNTSKSSVQEWTEIHSTNLIISCDKFWNCMESPCSHKLLRANHFLESSV